MFGKRTINMHRRSRSSALVTFPRSAKKRSPFAPPVKSSRETQWEIGETDDDEEGTVVTEDRSVVTDRSGDLLDLGCADPTNNNSNRSLKASERCKRDFFSVRFCSPDENVYYKSQKPSLQQHQQEKKARWYTEDDFIRFKEQNMEAVANLFESHADWKEMFQLVYIECRKVQKGNMDLLTGKVDRERLIQFFLNHEEMVGMERSILSILRGPATKLVSRVLKAWEDHHVKCEMECMDVDVSLLQLGHQRKQLQQQFASKCRSITQPSAVFAREVAVAQARAAAVCCSRSHPCTSVG